MLQLTRARRLLLGLGLALMAAFALLASEVLEAETTPLDEAGLQLAQQWRAASPQVEIVMRDLSGLGSGVALTLFTVATVGYLWLLRQRRLAAMVGASMALGECVVTALKAGIGRSRPDPALAAFVQHGLSFPSGHTSMSAIFFLTAGVLLAQHVPRTAMRTYVMTAAVLCTGLIGLSRIALGVHWASDVLAGWAFGAGWAALWLCAALPLIRARSLSLPPTASSGLADT